MAKRRSNSDFETTRWTLIRELGASDQSRRRAAMEKLVGVYWPAVYSYVRHSGVGREAAEGAAPEKGRLRSLILAALKRYRIDAHRRRRARGDGRLVALDDGRVLREEEALARRGSDGESPEAAFDRRWAMAQVEEALSRCRAHFERDKPRHWAAFEDRVMGPAVRLTAPTPLEALAGRLGFRTAADAAAAVQVVKKRFELLLREVIGETTEEVEEEHRYLAGML